MQEIDSDTRIAIARVCNIIRVLAAQSVPLSDTLLAEAYEWAVEQYGSVKDLLYEGELLVTSLSNRGQI
jgi:exosome complex component RRP4